VLGRNCRFLQGPDTDPEAVSALRAAIAARQPVSTRLTNYTQAGLRLFSARCVRQDALHGSAVRAGPSRGAVPRSLTCLSRSQDGVPFVNELRLEPVLEPGSGRLVAYVGVQNDVTQLVGRVGRVAGSTAREHGTRWCARAAGRGSRCAVPGG
jgi:hypothetical protein